MDCRRLNERLVDEGYRAALAGQPCEFRDSGELNRAAWEMGWRAGKQALGHRSQDALERGRAAFQALDCALRIDMSVPDEVLDALSRIEDWLEGQE